MTLLLDFETRSRCDLKKRGGRNYAEDPTTEILCCVLHDTNTGNAGVWLPGDPCPTLPTDTLAAHNADGFDRFIAARLGWPCSGWIDTSVLARRAGLPGALDELASRWLGTRKDLAASRFTKSLSTPSRAKKTKGQLPEITPERLERVIAYCASDVGILVHGWPRLKPWHDMGFEDAVYAWDREVNDRGVAFDTQLAKRLLEEDARNAEIVIRESSRVLRWSAEDVRACVGSPAQLTDALGKWATLYAKGVDEDGETKADAKADTLERLLADTSAPAWVRALVQARQAIASIARGKLEAGLARVSPDGRLRDNLRYYGAHTGRWSGRGMQLQNMPRPDKRFEEWGDAEVCREADRVLAGGHCDQATVDLLLRATLHAKSGHVLLCEDFSSVEARGNAWAANDRKAIRAFEQSLDVYKVIAAVIFGTTYDAVTKPQRQVGKVAELGCGYGMGAKKFHDTNAAAFTVAGVQAKAVVRDWRSLHAPIVRFWHALGDAFVAAARGKSRRVSCFEFAPDGDDVACFLPAGRPIVYNDVLITRDEKNREQAWYRGSKKRTKYGPDGREKTWGGTLCENVIQAMCRDLMAVAGVECSNRGLPAVLSVHDELLVEVPRREAKEARRELHEIMTTVPEWAEGFPLGADGHEGLRYRK